MDHHAPALRHGSPAHQIGGSGSVWLLAAVLAPALAAILTIMPGPARAAEAAETFPRPAALAPAVAFWTRVYSEVGTNGGLLHDSRRLDVVYAVLELPPGLSWKARRQRVNRVREAYREALLELAAGREPRSGEARRVRSLWGDDAGRDTLVAAAGRLRFQRGQADKFRAGLVRAGAWEEHIVATLRAAELPVELAALPHVESSYNPRAWSKVGAAGLWQFTRPTGRRFMRIDHVVDERLDPYRSTAAAARLLEYNHSVTGTWPLAITAYNHGLAGMRRAVRELGTTDIGTIVERYRGRRFGFASRNFYAAFLAALDVAADAEAHFGPIKREPPEQSPTLTTAAYLPAAEAARALGLELEDLRRANPALRNAVWDGSKYIPKGYSLRLPPGVSREPAAARLVAVARIAGQPRQRPDLRYTVQRGDTLSQIADRYGTTVASLAQANMLRDRHTIRAGQVLRLPGTPGAGDTVVAAAAPQAAAAGQGTGTYQIRRGDTLGAIARRVGVPAAELARMNALDDPYRLVAGQTLLLAEAETAAIPPAAQVAAPAEEAAGPEAEAGLEAAQLEDGAGEDAAPGPPLAGPLQADPADYAVAGDGTIEVQAAETLGHYAEWLDLRAWDLRRVNGLRFGQPVVVGQRLKLDFTNVSRERFEGARTEYQRNLQAAFFSSHRIVGTCEHRLRRGESLWTLAQGRYGVPLWLLRQYNPDLDLDAVLTLGTVIRIPLVTVVHDDAPEETPPPLEAAAQCPPAA